jgi:hypothetical protein
MSEDRCQRSDDRGQKTEVRGQKLEFGLRPLRAVGSPYDPEAIGAGLPYAPAGSGKAEFGMIKHRQWAWGRAHSVKKTDF